MTHEELPFAFRPKSTAWKLNLVIVLFVAIGALQYSLSYFQASILSAVRAYVGGEGLWSKAQKNAMQNLLRYAASHEEKYYEAFEQDLTVSFGDRRARLELQKPKPDMTIVYEGLLAGGNHPGDLDALIWLFRNFHDVPYLAKAIEIWAEGDREIAQMRHLAYELRDAIAHGRERERAMLILARLERVNERLTLLEDRFSFTLGEGARWVAWVSTAVSLAFTVVLLGIGALLGWNIIRDARKAGDALAQSEARFRRLAESNIISVAFWHENGRIVDANDAFLNMLGCSRDDLLVGGVDWRTFTPAAFQDKADAALAELAEKGVCTSFETEWVRKDGSTVPVLVGAALLDGQHDRGIAYAQDLSERKRAEEQLQLSAKVFEESGEGIMITDARNNIISVNRAFTEITGYAREEVIGRNPRLLQSGRHGPEYFSEMWAHLNSAGHWRGEIWDRRKTGEIYPKWLTIAAIRNEMNEVTNYAAIFSDITEQKSAQARIQHLAEHDFLTGLPNRMLLLDRVRQAIAHAKRSGKGLALMFIDLDRFKMINDTYGHRVGDQLLLSVARRLTDCVRGDDTVSRLGGDEFVIMARDVTDPAEVETVAQKVLESMRSPLVVDGREMEISVSIGIALFPREGDSVDELLQKADAAMYRAKQESCHSYRVFAPDMTRDLPLARASRADAEELPQRDRN